MNITQLVGWIEREILAIDEWMMEKSTPDTEISLLVGEKRTYKRVLSKIRGDTKWSLIKY